ncbi:armadillo-type protein [Roridomyces roridus]|uniref:Armadillo-type protein n=1 Tax=Roridomyces roridus TaxID=1738132 RepID=A0AAD7FGC3_9AGAR|nr:armadillo-type protein [Roridomyces roridus]
MPPLQRTETGRSLASWWSDNNPMLHISPTINLHAAAKPLMKLLYHQQALRIMDENRDQPLSEELLDIYSTYISCKYVSSRTGALVLAHLGERALEEDSSRRILCSPLLDHLTLQTRGNIPALRLIATLAARRLGAPFLPGVIVPISTMLHMEEDDQLVIAVITTLATSEDAGAVLSILLYSQNWRIRWQTCTLISGLAKERAVMPMILNGRIVEDLVGLLRDLDDSVVSHAISTLIEICQQPGGARSLLSTKIIENLPFDSTSISNRQRACALVLALAKRRPDIITTVERAIPRENWRNVVCPRLPDDEEYEDVSDGLRLLTTFARHGPEGMLISANTLEHLADPFSHLGEKAQRTACSLLGYLAEHQFGVTKILQTNLIPQLWTFLSYSIAASEATCALIAISKNPAGADAILAAVGDEHRIVRPLIATASSDIKHEACYLVIIARIAPYHWAAGVLVSLGVVNTLTSFLTPKDNREDDDYELIVEAAAQLLIRLNDRVDLMTFVDVAFLRERISRRAATSSRARELLEVFPI